MSVIDDAVNDYLRSEGLPTTPYAIGHWVGLRAYELPTIYRGSLTDRNQVLVRTASSPWSRRPASAIRRACAESETAFVGGYLEWGVPTFGRRLPPARRRRWARTSRPSS
ncbi:M24 family metallopeptidase [Mycobacterium tilburgii]|uniref:hypothetical protein n=1 Tax=Mycobacterium tilburgii TaxID=44467 RepID=UPI00164275BE|nr:hypothetical protein [Mycobacterium tilburgii]